MAVLTISQTLCRKPHCETISVQSNPRIASMFKTGYYSDTSLCQSCYFWMEKLSVTGIVTINGNIWTHYMVGSADSSMKGFDGRRWNIKITDDEGNKQKLAGTERRVGQSIETDNLWHQGTIPEEYHCMMIKAPNHLFVAITEV